MAENGRLGRAALTVESGVGEHADLLGDMVPSARRLARLELLAQQLPHLSDPTRHLLDVAVPGQWADVVAGRRLVSSASSQ